jgi:cation:H+ antiporter
MLRYKNHLFIFAAALIAVPGIFLRVTGMALTPGLMAFTSGCAILGASFLLLWACDAAQKDIPQAVALAVVALVAVLPEYAVSMYFTWQAGRHPESSYAQYAVANMTGGNRLIVGVAWALVAVLYWFKFRAAVTIERERRTELAFLGLATAYAFVIPLKGTLDWYDGVVLLAFYVWYIRIAGGRKIVVFEAQGPSELVITLPRRGRRAVTSAMFLFAAAAILANAKPFSEGLIATGKEFHVNEFLLVQWLAPIASEAPEFVVAIVFALRRQGGLALGSLLSSKLNQWTLLVGMIPWVYALATGGFAHPIPMGDFQMGEILLTAAQSLLAVVILSSMRLTAAEGVLLFVLFAGQLISPELAALFPGGRILGFAADRMHPIFSGLYCLAATAFILRRPRAIYDLRKGLSE